MFKRQAGIGLGGINELGGSGNVTSRNINDGVEGDKVNVEELVELFVALMVMTGFVEVSLCWYSFTAIGGSLC